MSNTRTMIPMRAFSFAKEYRGHDRFRVSITDELGSHVFEVRAWGNMVDAVSAFTGCVADHKETLRAKADIFRTGYASVAGMNVRVVPVS